MNKPAKKKPMSKATKRDAEIAAENARVRARDKWDAAHQAIDDLWGDLQDYTGRDMQEERDAALESLDALLAAAGIEEDE